MLKDALDCASNLSRVENLLQYQLSEVINRYDESGFCDLATDPVILI